MTALEFLKENNTITNKTYQELCKVSKATATRDLTELVDKFNIVKRVGDVGAGTLYRLIGSIGSKLAQKCGIKPRPGAYSRNVIGYLITENNQHFKLLK
ncbi:DeoR family transcriptional regulator [Geofilum rubicundum]|uniref:DeoR family transcriptional regulator n=1 Tax=Geofilum rubicundum TaxID=472113 RepID=UPI001D0E919A|nr:DeoR family transcriptional regulator [Geofilum rubicundum]